jgi:hypothetical protein
MMLSSQPPPSQGPPIMTPTSVVGPPHHHLPSPAGLHRLPPTSATAVPSGPSQIAYEGRVVSLLHASNGGSGGGGGGESAPWPPHSAASAAAAASHFHHHHHHHPQFNSHHHLSFGNFFAAGHRQAAAFQPGRGAGPFQHIEEEEERDDTSPSSSGGSPRTDETLGGDPSPPIAVPSAVAASAIPSVNLEESDEEKVESSSFLGSSSHLDEKSFEQHLESSSQLDERSFEQQHGVGSKEEEQEEGDERRPSSLDIIREQVEQLPRQLEQEEKCRMEEKEVAPATRVQEEQEGEEEGLQQPPLRSLVIRQDIQELSKEANMRNISEDKMEEEEEEEEVEDEEELRIDEEMEEGGESGLSFLKRMVQYFVYEFAISVLFKVGDSDPV